jgi:hypothetical protein
MKRYKICGIGFGRKTGLCGGLLKNKERLKARARLLGFDLWQEF